MATPGLLADLLRPLLVASEDAGANYLIDNQAKIVAELKTYGDAAVDFLAAEITNALPHDSMGQRMVRGEIQATVTNVAADLKAKLAAEEPLGIDALEAMLEKLSASAAGEKEPPPPPA